MKTLTFVYIKIKNQLYICLTWGFNSDSNKTFLSGVLDSVLQVNFYQVGLQIEIFIKNKSKLVVNTLLALIMDISFCSCGFFRWV